MSAAAISGLAASEWAMLLTLLDECSPEQLAEIRTILDSEKEPMATPMTPPPTPASTKSQQMAMDIWDEFKTESDPSAADLPSETLERIVLFAREVRNRTLDQVSAAVDKAYTKFTTTVVDSLVKLKD